MVWPTRILKWKTQATLCWIGKKSRMRQAIECGCQMVNRSRASMPGTTPNGRPKEKGSGQLPQTLPLVNQPYTRMGKDQNLQLIRHLFTRTQAVTQQQRTTF